MRAVAQHQLLASVIRELAAERSPACLLDPRGSFLFVNEAWDQYALANGGAPSCLGSSLIGTNWLDHIRGVEVRRLHADLLARALHPRGARPRPLIQVGESNTPTTAALVSSRFAPLIAHGGEPVALSIVHSVVRERPIEEVYDVVHRPADSYRNGQGQITQCSCCRRVRDWSEPERWDLVPEVLTRPFAGALALCELCGELHYNGVDAI
ncbi:MAG TPA: hypothetical protein VLV17_08115 [Anaeromyxobacteraceae bacterium]|nr:hypothetical protein [Anaeromyxobacteraceae bacterium]